MILAFNASLSQRNEIEADVMLCEPRALYPQSFCDSTPLSTLASGRVPASAIADRIRKGLLRDTQAERPLVGFAGQHFLLPQTVNCSAKRQREALLLDDKEKRTSVQNVWLYASNLFRSSFHW